MASAFAKGLYETEITAQRFGASESKGTPFFEIDFRVVGKYDPATRELAAIDPGNRSCRIYLKAGGEAEKIALDRLKALGIEGNFRQYDPTNPSHTSLAGKKVKMWNKGPNAKGYDEWNVFVPSDKERKPRVSDPNVAAKLDNIFGGKLGGTPPAPEVDVSTQPLPF